MFVVANIERLETELFIVANSYGSYGYLEDQIVLPFEGYDQAIDIMDELMAHIVWTSDKELYARLLRVTGISVEIKHPSDTAETLRQIEHDRDILIDLYRIKPIGSKEMPVWRRWTIKQLEKLIQIIGGNGKYDTN